MLDPGLVRLEHSPSGTFEDRASQVVVDRAFAPSEFHGRRDRRPAGRSTPRACSWSTTSARSAPRASRCRRKGGFHSDRSVWRFGLPTAEPRRHGAHPRQRRRRGAARARDARPRRRGVVDDSRTVLLTDDGWIAPRRPDTLDLYVFAYGHDYRAALRAFYHLTGPPPLLPRYALGNWWSRYHPYSAEEYLGLMDRFAAEGMPAVGRGDGHGLAPRRHRPRHGSGWTGYTWNRELFPDPPGVPRRPARARARDDPQRAPGRGRARPRGALRGDRAADGRRPRQRAAGRLRPADPAFLEAYLEELHHPRRPRAWTSGGWTGSRAGSPACPGWTRCGCSTTSTSWTPGARREAAR